MYELICMLIFKMDICFLLRILICLLPSIFKDQPSSDTHTRMWNGIEMSNFHPPDANLSSDIWMPKKVSMPANIDFPSL